MPLLASRGLSWPAARTTARPTRMRVAAFRANEVASASCLGLFRTTSRGWLPVEYARTGPGLKPSCRRRRPLTVSECQASGPGPPARARSESNEQPDDSSPLMQSPGNGPLPSLLSLGEAGRSRFQEVVSFSRSGSQDLPAHDQPGSPEDFEVLVPTPEEVCGQNSEEDTLVEYVQELKDLNPADEDLNRELEDASYSPFVWNPQLPRHSHQVDGETVWTDAVWTRAELAWSVLVVGPIVVIFWRGWWELADVYLLPENPSDSAFASFLTGIILIVLCLALRQARVLKWARNHYGSTTVAILERLYTLVCSVASIWFWRGIWEGVDQLDIDRGLSAILCCFFGTMALMFLNSLRSSTSSPLGYLRDGTNDAWDPMGPDRFEPPKPFTKRRNPPP